MSDLPPPPPASPPPPSADDFEPPNRLTIGQKQFIGFVLVVAAANVAYRLVYLAGAQQTAALYVGIPTILVIGVVMLPRGTSATEILVKGTTIAVLLAAVILPEGALCLIFAYPLVMIIALFVGLAVDWGLKRSRPQGPTLMVVTIPLLLMSAEGVLGSPFDANDSSIATVIVTATPSEVANALAATPRFDADLPAFLTLGFNRPVAATGSGLEVGDHRVIEFAGGSHDDHPMSLLGIVSGGGHDDEHTHMHLTIVESVPGRVVFEIDDDTTMLARWSDLRRAIVTWEAVDDHRTAVSWRLEYERHLHPTIYFAPLQRYGMSQAAGYLLDAIVADQLP
jgi:hypothetical protein